MKEETLFYKINTILFSMLLLCTIDDFASAQSVSEKNPLAIDSFQGSSVAGTVESLPKIVSNLGSPPKRLPFPSVAQFLKSLDAPFQVQGSRGTSLQQSRARGAGSESGVIPFAYGSYEVPYTTARVATGSDAATKSAENVPVSAYPYRAVGKLYFKDAGSWYVCTATLVKKGVLLTAAHCVFNFGKNRDKGYYSNFSFCPAHTSSASPYGPYGCFPASSPRVLSPYYNGTDSCYSSGVVCSNDVATLLVPKITTTANNGKYLGQVYGTIGYGYNLYGFVSNALFNDHTSAQITQLGYPAAFDSGVQMQRTDSLARAVTYSGSATTYNVVMGTAQTGGSSGGPWIVNFGTVPSVSSGSASLGSDATMVLVGVTSWGYSSVGVNFQGASYFGQNTEYTESAYGDYGAGNIGKLMYDTCTANSAYC